MKSILKNSALLKNQAYINAEWVNAKDGQTFPVTNPYDGSLLANVADIGIIEARMAIEAAHQAWINWRSATAKERSEYLLRWANLVEKHFLDIAILLTLEQGKLLEQAKLEIKYVITLLQWFAAEAIRIYGYTVTPLDKTIRLMTIKQPIGVVAAIAPWNFPASICMQKCVPAIAAGCTVVFKPAQDTPLTALALAHLAHEADMPAGVFNVLTCQNPASVGEELATNPLIRKLTFTGSTAVGKHLASKATNTIKKVCLELGGNCPFIIFSDANISKALDEAIALKFFNAGQICNNINRILVEESIYEKVVTQFVEKIKGIKLGSGLDPQAKLGPLINEAALQKVQRLILDAQQKGAILKMGGSRISGTLLYEPTVLSEVTKDTAMYQEEIFGPVAPFYRFKTEAEAIQMANDTAYGLAAYFFTADLDRIRRMSEALEAGSVGINTISIFSETMPFGGFKESGIGREGGVIGSLDHYCEIKTLASGNLA